MQADKPGLGLRSPGVDFNHVLSKVSTHNAQISKTVMIHD
jgi:hypothetical protein